MDSELAFLHFDSIEAAERAMATIGTLAAEGFVVLGDAAIISRSDDGWVSVKPVGRTDAATSTGLGGVLGLIAGGLLGLPVLGAVAGAGIASKKSRDDDHLGELVSTVGRDMAPGTAVLALTVAELTDPEMVTDRLQVHRDRLIRVEIPAQLRERLGDAT